MSKRIMIGTHGILLFMLNFFQLLFFDSVNRKYLDIYIRVYLYICVWYTMDFHSSFSKQHLHEISLSSIFNRNIFHWVLSKLECEMKLKKSKTKKEVEAILFAISIMLRTRITPFIHYQSFSRIDQFIFENVSCFGIALPSFYFQLAAWYLIDMTAFWLFFFLLGRFHTDNRIFDELYAFISQSSSWPWLLLTRCKSRAHVPKDTN